MSYRRIACLSTEVVETLYLLGAEDAVAGISGFTVRPARARREKPKVSGFSRSRIERILAVRPDLVIGFSDLQAPVVDQLIRAGIEVHVFNQRDLAGMLRMIATLARLADRTEQGERLIADLRSRLESARDRAGRLPRRPRLYFEEWNDPIISGIRWVSELIEAAGAEDCFAAESHHAAASGRIIADPQEVVKRSPEIVVGSWCGKKFRQEELVARAGWSVIPAIRNGRVYEIKSADILSPGPSAITHGLAQLERIVGLWERTAD